MPEELHIFALFLPLPQNPPSGERDQKNSFTFWINLSNNLGLDTTHMVYDMPDKIFRFAPLLPQPLSPTPGDGIKKFLQILIQPSQITWI